MEATRLVRLFRNGRNQAIRIPRAAELRDTHLRRELRVSAEH